MMAMPEPERMRGPELAPERMREPVATQEPGPTLATLGRGLTLALERVAVRRLEPRAMPEQRPMLARGPEQMLGPMPARVARTQVAQVPSPARAAVADGG